MATKKQPRKKGASKKTTGKKKAKPRGKPKTKQGLTQIQEELAQEYILCQGNQSEAYRKVYPNSKATIKVLWSLASRAFSHVKVQQRIMELQKNSSDKSGIDAAWVLTRLARLHDITLESFLTIPKDGSEPYYDFRKASKEDIAALESCQIDITSAGNIKTSKIKLALPNKLKVLELIGKHIGVNAFKEHLDVNGTITLVVDNQDKDL